jgi:hypothetical protein
MSHIGQRSRFNPIASTPTTSTTTRNQFGIVQLILVEGSVRKLIADSIPALLGSGTRPLLEVPVHHKGVDVAQGGMQEGSRETAYDFEVESLPEADGPFVCTDDEIELHGAEAPAGGMFDRMSAHGAGYTFA